MGTWWPSHLQTSCFLSYLLHFYRSGLKWASHTCYVGKSWKGCSKCILHLGEAAGRRGADHFESCQQEVIRSRPSAPLTICNHVLLMTQSPSHASTCQRCWAPDVEYAAGRDGHMNCMVAGFVWGARRLVELTLAANEKKALSLARGVCWGTSWPRWLLAWGRQVSWILASSLIQNVLSCTGVQGHPVSSCTLTMWI